MKRFKTSGDLAAGFSHSNVLCDSWKRQENPDSLQGLLKGGSAAKKGETEQLQEMYYSCRNMKLVGSGGGFGGISLGLITTVGCCGDVGSPGRGER